VSAQDGRGALPTVFLTALFVIPSGVEEAVVRDYNFWVYIVTNEHDSVLYVGMTNDLARRISEHRTGEIPGFAAD